MQRRLFASALFLACAGAAAWAQTPKLAIKGYDTVAYFTVGKPTKGNPAISQDWDGARYLFASEENRRLFAANPDKYAPQFSGLCAVALAEGMKIEAEPENWMISGGRLYLFAGPVPADTLSDPSIVANAQANWKKMKK